MSRVSVVERLEAIEAQRRPFYKIALSRLEGGIGHALFRRPPPACAAPRRLHLGCGDHHFAGWVNADYYRFSDLVRKRRPLPDWMLDIARPWRCPPDHWDGIHTEHTLEHLDYRGATMALREAHRTLRPGGWLRVVLPCADRALQDPGCPTRGEALATLTQTHGHLSVWDATLLGALLTEIGFCEVRPVAFGQGSDAALVRDLETRATESLYLEARKPCLAQPT